MTAIVGDGGGDDGGGKRCFTSTSCASTGHYHPRLGRLETHIGSGFNG